MNPIKPPLHPGLAEVFRMTQACQITNPHQVIFSYGAHIANLPNKRLLRMFITRKPMHIWRMGRYVDFGKRV